LVHEAAAPPSDQPETFLGLPSRSQNLLMRHHCRKRRLKWWNGSGYEPSRGKCNSELSNSLVVGIDPFQGFLQAHCDPAYAAIEPQLIFDGPFPVS
jgi:hypothetical protein